MVEPAPVAESRTVLEHLTELYEENGVPTRFARRFANDWLNAHAVELESMFGAEQAGL